MLCNPPTISHAPPRFIWGVFLPLPVKFWSLVCLSLLVSGCGGGGGGVLNKTPTLPGLPDGQYIGTSTPFSTSDQEFRNFSQTIDAHPLSITNVVHAYQKGLSGKGQTIVIVDSHFDSSSSYTNENIELRAHPEMQAKYSDASTGGLSWNPEKPIQQGTADLPHGNIIASIAAAPFNKDLGADFYCSVTDGSRDTDCYPREGNNTLLNHGMHGVAFNSSLYLIDYEPNSFSLDSLASEIQTSTNSTTKVMNNSWGISLSRGTYRNEQVATLGNDIPLGMSVDNASVWLETRTRLTAQSWKNYLNSLTSFQQRGVVVFSLQNEADATSASVTAGLPNVYPNLYNAWIAVGNIEAREVLGQLVVTRVGSKCLETAPYCLVADGTGVVGAGYRDIPYGPGSEAGSAYNGLYRAASGTSLAAPQISGMIALLAEAFPNLTPAQLTTRLLASANNDFLFLSGGQVQRVVNTGTRDFGNGITHAYSEDFGHGIPNMAAALAPIGTTVIPTTSDVLNRSASVSLEDSLVITSPAFGDAFLRSTEGVRLTAYDSLYAGFPLRLDSLIRSRPPASGLSIERRNLNSSDPLHNRRPTRMHRLVSDGIHFSLGLNESLADSSSQGLGMHEKSPINPYMARFNRHKTPLGIADEQRDLRFGLMTKNTEVSMYVDRGQTLTRTEQGTTQGLALRRFLYNNENITLNLLAGYQIEKHAFRNAVSKGAFSIGSETSTWFLSPVVKFANGEFILSATGTFSVSSAPNASWEKSLIRSFSAFTTSGWQLDAKLSNHLMNRDQVFIRIWQPERVESGQLSMALPGMVNLNEQISFEALAISLAPSGREVNLGVGYVFPLTLKATLALEAILSKDPGHIRSDKAHSSLVTTLEIRF